MKTLWAPWRIEYVLQEKPESCIFCIGEPGEEGDKENLILARGTESFVMMNLYPYNNGHLMVSPYTHTADIAAISDSAHLEMMHHVQEWTDVLLESMNPEGFNIGVNLGEVAGAGVEDHYHMHIVPRWGGDTNFMPVLGHTKVVVEGLEETWQTLVTTYEAIYGARNKTD